MLLLTLHLFSWLFVLFWFLVCSHSLCSAQSCSPLLFLWQRKTQEDARIYLKSGLWLHVLSNTETCCVSTLQERELKCSGEGRSRSVSCHSNASSSHRHSSFPRSPSSIFSPVLEWEVEFSTFCSLMALRVCLCCHWKAESGELIPSQLLFLFPHHPSHFSAYAVVTPKWQSPGRKPVLNKYPGMLGPTLASGNGQARAWHEGKADNCKDQNLLLTPEGKGYRG